VVVVSRVVIPGDDSGRDATIDVFVGPEIQGHIREGLRHPLIRYIANLDLRVERDISVGDDAAVREEDSHRNGPVRRDPELRDELVLAQESRPTIDHPHARTARQKPMVVVDVHLDVERQRS